MTVFPAVSAVFEQRASRSEFLLLEKRRSMEILTPGMARTSLAIGASPGKYLLPLT
jgi:hypothetical protein